MVHGGKSRFSTWSALTIDTFIIVQGKIATAFRLKSLVERLKDMLQLKNLFPAVTLSWLDWKMEAPGVMQKLGQDLC
ncbi:Hypothetical predicted protein [Marmota monax]|uniref:Uncharacterized protein n=1 Tax=Marmota monax TaxID=9995 RepID=A0A5E4BLX3_MARMO|nr:hypothetical protein GHT09_020502 [Marmota monax]VTJ70598.1 Hypothetical predicted protein [Marmota monax]